MAAEFSGGAPFASLPGTVKREVIGGDVQNEEDELILLSLAATAVVLLVGGLLLDAVGRFPLGGWLAFIGLLLSFLCLALARARDRTRVERWSRDLSRLGARVVRSLSRRRE